MKHNSYTIHLDVDITNVDITNVDESVETLETFEKHFQSLYNISYPVG
jgi:hypothetical protein